MTVAVIVAVAIEARGQYAKAKQKATSADKKEVSR